MWDRRASQYLAAGAALVLLAAAGARAETWWVDDDAAGPGDGSPGDPFPTIQAAVSAAASGDTVYVQDGFYTEGVHLGSKNLVLVSANGPDLTILSGAGLSSNNNILRIEGGQDATTLIRGFTLTGAIERLNLALSVVGSDPTIENCVFAGNQSPNSRRGPGNVGAVFINGGSPTFTDCVFRHNAAGNDAGAMMIQGPNNGTPTRPVFSCCTFENNSAERLGGAIVVWNTDEAVHATFDGCLFRANSISPGIPGVTNGGLSVHVSGGGSEFVDCTFKDHVTGWRAGAAVQVFNGPKTTSFDRCVFENNHGVNGLNNSLFVTRAGGFGGPSGDLADVLVRQCRFENNTGHNAFWANGGRIVIVDTQFINNTSDGGEPAALGLDLAYDGIFGWVYNCIFQGNTSLGSGAHGGAVTGHGAVFQNCLFVDNHATDPDSSAGALSLAYGVVRSCTFYNNSAPNAPFTVKQHTAGSNVHNSIIWGPGGGQVDVSDVQFCTIAGGFADGTNILTTDPLFVDPDGPDNDLSTWQDNDFSLMPGSPSIDNGWSVSFARDKHDIDEDGDTDEKIPIDIAGNPRRIDDPSKPDCEAFGAGVCDAAPLPDIGAYEGPWAPFPVIEGAAGAGGCSDPFGVDTDADGLSDGDETQTYGTDPLDPDTDGDGLIDGDEVLTYGTDPLNPDTDGDTVGDAVDSDPLDPFVCRDADGDGCDDCSSGVADPANDGPDFDGDGRCDVRDPDDDNDGVSDIDEASLGSDPFDADTDDDGLGDGQELDRGTDPVDADTDDDGLSDSAEIAVCTDPLDPDTDDDGASDGDEIDAGSDPLDGDTDDDGLTDGAEAAAGTDPLEPDTDGDGLPDGDEVHAFGSDPLDADTDDDGLDDSAEVAICTDPNNADTDADGLADGDEVAVGSDPLDADTDNDGVADGGDSAPLDALVCRDLDGDGCDDCSSGTVNAADDGPDNDLDGLCDAGDADDDNDGLSDVDEAGLGTDPFVWDTDADGLSDGDEVGVIGTDPLRPDTDGDMLDDGDEIAAGTDPFDPDTDGDTVPDGVDSDPLDTFVCADLDADECEDCSSGTLDPAADGPDADADGLCDAGDPDDDNDGLDDNDEAAHGTDPLDADTDDDGLEDGSEVTLGTDPLNADTDADGLDDGEEITRGTDPLNPDSDGDGLSDGDEVDMADFGGCPDPLVADSDGDFLDDGVEFLLGLDPCDTDTDADGLADGQEESLGTDPLDPDTDDDGFFDGTEVDIAQGTGCPDPTIPDSDGDTIQDGAEADLGTDPCDPDTDGDTVPDNEDDLPTEPGVTSGYIEDELRGLCEYLESLPLEVFDAPNDNARRGRRTALCNKLRASAKQVARENFEGALGKIENDLLPKLDSAGSPADWMVEGDEKAQLRADLEQLAYLLSLELE
ncbi:MAG: right-handed parallel beta-helix repeat-containing protein [Planctomycetota bacterium]|jgi:hypothetical protein